MRMLLSLLVFLLLFPSISLAWRGNVVSVNDGDSLLVQREDTGEKVRIRLYGIDAPETQWKGRWKSQPYSRMARDFLRALLPVGTLVTIDERYQDRYDRTVGGIVVLPDGDIVQVEMLKAGMAWVYPKYCRDCQYWKNLQEEARASKQGLWRDRNPVPPWEWRR